MASPTKTDEEWALELLETKKRHRLQLENFSTQIDDVIARRDAVKAEVEALTAEAEAALAANRAEQAKAEQAGKEPVRMWGTGEGEMEEDHIVDILSDLLAFSAKKSSIKHSSTEKR